MQASTTERTEAEEVASPCMAVTTSALFSAFMEEAARSAAGREMSQPKIIAPWRAKRVAIVVPLPHPVGGSSAHVTLPVEHSAEQPSETHPIPLTSTTLPVRSWIVIVLSAPNRSLQQ